MSAVINLARNEFLFDHPLLQPDTLPKLSAEDICQYHMNSKLAQKLADFHGINQECLSLCNGAEHVLKTAINAVSHMPDTVLLIPSPSWEYYWKLAKEYSANAVPYYYRETNDAFELGYEELEEQIRLVKRVVLLIASPSNPLGSRTDDATIHKLVKLVGEKGFTILDQTYVGFSDDHEETLLTSLQTLPNTLIVRSLSKYYGMPGLRVGFVAASSSVQKAFSIIGDYLGFNAFSDRFATECLSRHSEFVDIANQTIQERERLKRFFSSLPGFKAFRSHTNFLLIRTPEKEYAGYLLENGIKIRTFSDEVLEDCVRITIPPRGIANHLERLTSRYCANNQKTTHH